MLFKRFFYFGLSLFILFSMIFVSFFLIRSSFNRPYTYKNFTKDFSLSINDEEIFLDDISALPNISLNTGDVVILRRTMPATTMSDAMLLCDIFYASIEIRLNGELIYSYGLDEQLNSVGKLGAGYHSVRLPNNHQGKELSIKVIPSSAYKLHFIITDISLTTSHDIIIPTVRDSMLSFYISIFLLIFSVLLFLVHIVLMLLKIDSEGMVPLSVSSFAIGMWEIANKDFIRLFIDDLLIINYVNYFSFYLAIIPWIVMIDELRESRYLDKVVKAIKWAYMIAFPAIILSYLIFGTDYKIFLLPYTIIDCLVLVVLIYITGHDFKNQKLHERIMFFGNILAVFYLIAQALIYNIGKYQGDVNIKDMPNAALIMIFTFFAAYMLRFVDNLATQKETKVLQRLAYTDSLTNLENRQSALLKLRQMDDDKSDYIMILFDLNNLKPVNDRYGHSRGDKLIQDFSTCIHNYFQDAVVKCRLGGDEFLVVIKAEDASPCDELMHGFYERIAQVNQQSEDSVMLDAAYGIVSTKEQGCHNNSKLLHEADLRMYAQKQETKKGLCPGKQEP